MAICNFKIIIDIYEKMSKDTYFLADHDTAKDITNMILNIRDELEKSYIRPYIDPIKII